MKRESSEAHHWGGRLLVCRKDHGIYNVDWNDILKHRVR